jgi:hypothetical protein
MVWLAGALALALAAAAQADVFELADGGRVVGQMVESKGGKQGSYVIELAAGGRVTLPRTQVVKVTTTSSVEAQYQKLARSTPDTAADQWKLAQWCRDQKLRDEAERHMARVVELDPNHEAARAGLGFKQKDGDWVNRDQIMASRGLVMYEGHYVAPQHVELMEQQKKAKLTQADWAKTIERLRRALTGRNQDRAGQAFAEIKSIEDPQAAEAIVEVLRRENNPELKKLWIEVAARLNHQAAVNELVHLSLADEDPEVRRDCLEYLARSGRAGLVTPYVKALKSNDNVIVNRAGEALAEIGNSDAIGPLIDAIVTTHKVQVSDSNPDQHAYTFTPSGGSAYTFGGGGPKFVSVPVKNPSVLTALVKLSGGTSFDYDKAQWRGWLAAQAKANAVDLRRDR